LSTVHGVDDAYAAHYARWESIRQPVVWA